MREDQRRIAERMMRAGKTDEAVEAGTGAKLLEVIALRATQASAPLRPDPDGRLNAQARDGATR